MNTPTFLWHDYETFGVDPSRDRPSQFAAIRTDMELNIIGEPMMWYCKPADDVLPQPEACLITGVTPQQCLRKGVCEAEFMALIDEQMSRPNTCSVGYNSIRFDDEVSRYGFYRNFIDPYGREYLNGNSRWDLIDVLRMTYALRPEGIEWPLNDDGLPSFRLELLTAANGIGHENAHDALSDVYATIAVAKLIKEKQPRLFDYAFKLRQKTVVGGMVDVNKLTPLFNVSGMFGSARGCISLVVPLLTHPVNKNEVICFDLLQSPQTLVAMTAEEIAQWLYTPARDLPAGVVRPALKSIHLNKSPMIGPAKMFTEDAAMAARLGHDVQAYRENFKALRTQDIAAIKAKLLAVYSQPREFAAITDPDRMLYSGGFFSRDDKQTMARIRKMAPLELAESSFSFDDGRLQEMLFRYRARNYPETLSLDEYQQWQEFRELRLMDPNGGGSITFEDYMLKIEQLFNEGRSDQQQQILQALVEYADIIGGG
ncbi:exodeoxyribonuclease I subunit C [Sinobacterium caligoides]|uniref:Exodeoxyribonuclease I n=1 Tax=Sinobacterium caligoides TaxID=933926 RepID=A0A3N2D4M8_9GAMM|nr:exodeoxyribonuclease I [Sinobacterium caligoides]ROR94757.1 exodeoxyribonuclease I subunit C [Sinobacterium caligoides]